MTNNTLHYALYGALFGCCFPLCSTFFDLYVQGLDMTLANLAHVQSGQPLHWVIDSAPFVLGAVASLAGRRQDRIAGINAALERERDRAEAANRAKSQFLANMSHELRTPLNAIIGYSDMLMEEAAAEGKAEHGEDLRNIKESGQHLLEIIAGILDLSKIEAGTVDVDLEDFAVGPLIEEVAGMVRHLAVQNGNALTVHVDDGLGEITSDRIKLRQILYNLLGNACKFTRDGQVAVDAKRDGGELAITVRDTGIGLDADQLDHLFEAFTQADYSSTRAHGGSGLGLAICHHFSELLGGRIEVESQPGAGAVFALRLPAEPDIPQAA